jgi:hypothetical protein
MQKKNMKTQNTIGLLFILVRKHVYGYNTAMSEKQQRTKQATTKVLVLGRQRRGDHRRPPGYVSYVPTMK